MSVSLSAIGSTDLKQLTNNMTKPMPLAKVATHRQGPARRPHEVPKQRVWRLADATGYRVISETERADAIWLAVNAELVMPALSASRIAYPTRVRRHIRENMRPIYVKCRYDCLYPATAQECQSSSDEAETPASAEVLRISPAGEVRGLPSRASHAAKKYMRSLPDRAARSMIGQACKKKGGKEIWDLILMAHDHRFLTQTRRTPAVTTLRVLFSDSPRDSGAKM